MMWNRGMGYSEDGLTLLEILFALIISAIILMTALRLFTDQWRGTRNLKNHLEAHYAVMTSGKTVSDAIRMANTVEWMNNTAVLVVLPMPDEVNPVPTLDSYFIDDLDQDGTKDLYWKHLGVSQPLASNIVTWECVEVEPGLWEIILKASVDGQSVTWRGSIRRRTYSPESLETVVSPISVEQRVMSAFLSCFC